MHATFLVQLNSMNFLLDHHSDVNMRMVDRPNGIMITFSPLTMGKADVGFYHGIIAGLSAMNCERVWVVNDNDGLWN